MFLEDGKNYAGLYERPAIPQSVTAICPSMPFQTASREVREGDLPKLFDVWELTNQDGQLVALPLRSNIEEVALAELTSVREQSGYEIVYYQSHRIF